MSDIHGDRRKTRKLLARLRDPKTNVDDLSDIADGLAETEDPRAVAPLRELLEDRNKSRELREAASRALGAIEFEVPEQTLLRWWKSGDRVLQAHALGLMDDVQSTDILLGVAADPRHPLHSAAIHGLGSGFWRPEHQRLKIAALNHPAPEVRRAATGALLLDEPVAAEPALVRCLEDADLSVVDGAAQTLEYYPSVAVVKALAARIRRGPPPFDEDLAELEQLHWQSVLDTFEALRESIREALVQAEAAVRAELRAWLAPAWSELGYGDDELHPVPRERGQPAPRPPRRRLSAWDLEQVLQDPDTPVSVLRSLGDVDVASYDAPERARVFHLLASSGDSERLELLATFCEETADAEHLLGLTQDPRFLVRKTAMYHLGCLPADPTLAPRILEHWRRPDARGTHGYETLEAYMHHAKPADARRLALAVAADSAQDPDSRFHCIHALDKLRATEELQQLLALLDEPPGVTWSLHNALLEVAAKHRLSVSPAAIEALGAVDNLHLRVALAGYRSAVSTPAG